MSELEIDEVIAMLDTTFDEPVRKLLDIGEPALIRLLQGSADKTPPELFQVPKNAMAAVEHMTDAIAALTSKWPEETIALIREGKIALTMRVLLGLRLCTDARVRQIARDAFKSGKF
jgi:hypothetical protein